MSLISTVRLALALGMAAVLATPVAAQIRFPDKPVRIVVPYPAGISPDVVARLLGDKLSQQWGQPVLIDNRPGASGMIGAEAVVKSKPDGYTVLLAVSAIMSMNPHLYPKQPYDVAKDLKPVVQVLSVPFVLTAARDSPFNNLKELVEEARKNPGKINYASLGAGSQSHVAMEWFSSRNQIRINHIPYKGSPLNEMMSGAVALYLDPVVTAMPLVAGQKVKALAVTSRTRNTTLPNVPTFAELGFPGYETNSFQGIFVPAETPADVVAKLNADFALVIRSPEIQKKLIDLGYLPVGGTPEEFARVVREDYDLWGRVIRENNIRVD